MVRGLALVVAFVVVSGVVLGLLAVVTAVSLTHVPSPVSAAAVEVQLPPLDQRSLVYDRNGTVVAVLHAEQNRAVVPLEAIPDPVVATVLASEDQHFYEHDGIDLRASLRALLVDLDAGTVDQGGSTITQQLVKGSVVGDEQDLGRKAEEAVLALQLERQLSKDEILQRYLNQVYFGNGAYGVQAAAEVYWGLDAADLGWEHAALLASLIPAPSQYDPEGRPSEARRRLDVVVDRLVEEGHVGEAEAARLRSQPLPIPRPGSYPTPAQPFVREVVERLLDDGRLGATRTERAALVHRGGLRIHTTYDPAIQLAAEAAKAANRPSGGAATAIVAVDPATGAVRALASTVSADDRFDLVTDGLRQPGSAFKVVVLAAALEQGMVPADRIDGRAPCAFANPGGSPDPYVADLARGGDGGWATLTEQTARSSNCAFLRLGQEVGGQAVVAMARRLGISTRLDAGAPSLPIGTFEVRPLEMAGVMATIAAGGQRHPLHLVEHVTTWAGQTVLRDDGRSTQAISRSTACQLQQVLAANVDHGTATAGQLGATPAAGKTGTTQAHADAWFVGATPHLAAVVWMGSPDGRAAVVDERGAAVVGGELPTAAWRALMSSAGGAGGSWCEPGHQRPGRAIGVVEPSLPAPPPTASGRDDPSTATAPGVVLTCPPGYVAQLAAGLASCLPAR